MVSGGGLWGGLLDSSPLCLIAIICNGFYEVNKN